MAQNVTRKETSERIVNVVGIYGKPFSRTMAAQLGRTNLKLGDKTCYVNPSMIVGRGSQGTGPRARNNRSYGPILQIVQFYGHEEK